MDWQRTIGRRHDTDSSRPDFVDLYQVARGQVGHFTPVQARACGISRALLQRHINTGSTIRVHRGVYRFRDYPSTPREEVLAAWLAVGKDVAVVSHESALDLLDLTDIIPYRIDVTVPRARRYLHVPRDVTLHTTARPLGPSGAAFREGIRITTATRTIVDIAEAGLSEEHVQGAVEGAAYLGLTSPALLRAESTGRSQRVQNVIERAITAATA